MPIRIKCPKCQAALAVKDSLAGKKVSCPKCRNPLAIPTPKVSTPTGPTEADADAEAEALKAFAEETVKPVVAPKFIEIECAFCMETVKVSADLSGKQTPCPNPECKRIIKVPLLKEEKPKDWRQVNPRIAGGLLKTDAKEPEGVWGTAQTTRVSTESLIEANAIPIKKKPVTKAMWIKRGAYALLVVAAVTASVWGLMIWLDSGQVQASLNNALEQVKSNTRLKPSASASILRGAGQFRLLSGDTDSAQKQFRAAIFKLGDPDADGKLDAGRDTALLDLASAWMDLADRQGQSDAGEDWSEQVRRTLQKMSSVDAKLSALRQVASRIRNKSQDEKGKALWLASQLVPSPTLPKNLDPVPPDDKDKKGDGEKKTQLVVRSPLVSQQIALLLVAGKASEAAAIEPLPAGKEKEIDLAARLGYAEGMARLDKYAEAREIAKQKGQDPHRLEASVAIATIAIADSKAAQAKENTQDALAIFNDLQRRNTRISPWLTIQLTRACVRAGLAADAKKTADSLSADEEKESKALAQMELLLVVIENSTGPLPATVIDEHVTVKGTLGYQLALQSLARHNTRHGGRSQALAMLDGLDDSQKAFVWIGVAEGSVDGKK